MKAIYSTSVLCIKISTDYKYSTKYLYKRTFTTLDKADIKNGYMGILWAITLICTVLIFRVQLQCTKYYLVDKKVQQTTLLITHTWKRRQHNTQTITSLLIFLPEKTLLMFCRIDWLGRMPSLAFPVILCSCAPMVQRQVFFLMALFLKLVPLSGNLHVDDVRHD